VTSAAGFRREEELDFASVISQLAIDLDGRVAVPGPDASGVRRASTFDQSHGLRGNVAP
jgi:hypothetical protein